MLDFKWSDKKMIYGLILKMDHATLLQLRKKKLCCVSVPIAVTNTTAAAKCKFKNADWFEIIYFLSFDGDSFNSIKWSKCDHDLTYGLANYRGSPMTTGSYRNPDCWVKTELYNFGTDRWNDYPDYPFSS